MSDWDKVKVNARQYGRDGLPIPPEGPIHAFMREGRTAKIALDMMKARFPTPEAARQAYDSNKAWHQEHDLKFFQQRPDMDEHAQGWKSFEDDLSRYHIAQADRGIEPARVESFDFSGLDERPNVIAWGRDDGWER